ncbi:MAG: sodium:calcium antiporter [Actinomycetes bacterium]
MSAVLHCALLLGCALAIYFACEWFVNAVEWLGIRMQLGTIAIGSVLAAIGTALPESVVTLVAVTLGDSAESKQIGIGAALGGPLVLATIAYGVTGWMLFRRRRRRRLVGEIVGDPMAGVDLPRLARDQKWFLTIFVVKVSLGLVAFAIKPWLGLLFFAAYGAYFVREMRDDAQTHTDADLEPLKLQPGRSSPSGWAVLVQTLVTLVIIFIASEIFVAQLEWAGPALGLSASVTALLLSPVATELPEVMNAVIWVRQGKTSLALANISGAMMIQATVPSGLGLLFTPWLFDGPLLLSGLVTMAAIIYLLLLLHTHRFTPGRVAFAALFYAVFAAGLVLMA